MPELRCIKLDENQFFRERATEGPPGTTAHGGEDQRCRSEYETGIANLKRPPSLEEWLDNAGAGRSSVATGCLRITATSLTCGQLVTSRTCALQDMWARRQPPADILNGGGVSCYGPDE